jgi:hypothetical protein
MAMSVDAIKAARSSNVAITAADELGFRITDYAYSATMRNR